MNPASLMAPEVLFEGEAFNHLFRACRVQIDEKVGVMDGTGSGSGGAGGGGMICPFGTIGTPATCVLINIPQNGVRRNSGLAAIKDFQRFLNWTLGNKIVPLAIDGRWGAKTTAVIKLYQRLNGLKVDGSFGKFSAGKAITILKNANLYRQ
jgi:hypothetical protein